MAKEKLPTSFLLAGTLTAKSQSLDLLRLYHDIANAKPLGDIQTWVGAPSACSMLKTRIAQSGGYIDHNQDASFLSILFNPAMAQFTRQQFNAMWFCFILEYHTQRQGYLSLAFEFLESPSEPAKQARIDYNISTVLFELD